MSIFSELVGGGGGGKFTTNPQLIPWAFEDEDLVGIPHISGGARTVYPLNGATAWTDLAAAGDTAQVVADDTYATITNVASGSGIVTNIILPGVTTLGDTVSVKITLDGVETELTFTTTHAEHRFFSGFHYSDIIEDGHPGWDEISVAGGIAFQTQGDTADISIGTPSEQLFYATCLRFSTSLKVEMKSSDYNTGDYRDYGAVIYTLDQ